MRLFLSATPHGFGHAALLAAVTDALRSRAADLHLTLMTSLPESWLRRRFGSIDSLVPDPPDFGMMMTGPTVVDVPASVSAYREIAAEHDTLVDRQAAMIRDSRADVVVTSISPLTLAAAARAGRPAVGIAPFTWVEILRHYLADHPQTGGGVLDLLRADYATASAILAPEPAMAMETSAPVYPIGPVRHPPHPLPCAPQTLVGRSADIRIGLVGFGGIDADLPVAGWPYMPGWHWIVARADFGDRPDMTRLEDLEVGFSDLLPAVDLVVAKPGYGTFVEAAVAGRPVLAASRADWPESPVICAWAARHVPLLQVPWHDLIAGRGLGDAVGRLMDTAMPPRPLPDPTGAAEAAEVILDLGARRAR